jgi:hypothetical protein
MATKKATKVATGGKSYLRLRDLSIYIGGGWQAEVAEGPGGVFREQF